MADTKIEWADAVWNPITGCTKISAGCANCYAERMSKRLRGRCGYPADEPFSVTLHPDRMKEPLKIKKPKRIFVCSMGDLFHKDVSYGFIDKVWGIMSVAPRHTFLILTKRPELMAEIIPRLKERHIARDGSRWPLPNVHLGVSVEDQATADERIPLLLQTPAAKRFVSIEPMLGPVDLTDLAPDAPGKGHTDEDRKVGGHHIDAIGCDVGVEDDELYGGAVLDGVILGGETGPGARPMHPSWARKIRDDCKAAGVPFMFKQWGAWAPVHELRVNEPGIVGKPWHNFDPDNSVCKVGKKAAGHLLDGVEHKELP